MDQSPTIHLGVLIEMSYSREALKNETGMLAMFVHEGEIGTAKHLVHEPLEHLSYISKAKRHV